MPSGQPAGSRRYIDDMTPEESELEKKRCVLERLKDRLATAEEEMADLRAAQEQFEARYTMEVARLYAEHDEIEAQIAEEEYKLVPDDEEIKKKAEELRRRAEESAARAAENAEIAGSGFDPTSEARRAYHNLARIIHPDLALDESEREKRHLLMAELNAAYSSGDRARLDKLAEDHRHSPELVAGDSVGDQLIRAIRQISQVKARLLGLKGEKQETLASELYALRRQVETESAKGRDLLAQMAARTRVHIKKSERRLANLRNVNRAAEEYVKDRYGLNIGDFRGKPGS